MNTIAETTKPVLTEYVTKDAGILGGKPCIKGTRIRVQDIYAFHEHYAKSIDEIIEGWPYLTHAQVHGALAYAWEHQDEILALIQKQKDFDEELVRNGKSLTQKTMERLHGKSA